MRESKYLVIPPDEQAYSDILDAGEMISKTVARAMSTTHGLSLHAEVLAKLAEAQQAIFAAQRLMEAT